ncbi:uncharacterized protein CLUP02_10199 [Colletotrichum lupini]|uniref:Uncharacterized protein n=1 Tax=Colletotrichum lupini TaxID=145971 RepID=A0A9Q8SWD3_9PEZI|nr:uncharacterized protein CLUP02_10199 [Colletotrichum lupini]UQC84703.1 hypothetical protein CLUP02_10199 [Colletotrichum lupini]
MLSSLSLLRLFYPFSSWSQMIGSSSFALDSHYDPGNMAESLTTREGCHLILHLKASASNIPGCSRHAPTSSPLHLRALYSPIHPRLALRLILPHQNRGLRSLKSLPTPKGNKSNNRSPPFLHLRFCALPCQGAASPAPGPPSESERSDGQEKENDRKPWRSAMDAFFPSSFRPLHQTCQLHVTLKLYSVLSLLF